MSSSCCPSEVKKETSCSSNKRRFDYLLWGSLSIVTVGYSVHLAGIKQGHLAHFSHGVFELMNSMWWGLGLAFVFVGMLNRIPRELVMGVLGTKRGLTGILRATAGGLLLDLCNHGILVIGMKLYERGASLGQTVAFLVASPWNSFSMTIILIALIGLPKTIVFIGLSCVIAIISGLIFEKLVLNGTLPDNPNTIELPENMKLGTEFRKILRSADFTPRNILSVIVEGIRGSKMILRWIFFGVVLASLIRVLLSPEAFESFFGPSLVGLSLTLLAATVIEVCSEGSAPIAADLVTLAKAPGNGFTFLMAGVSTDYTEIMAIKETTLSWKIALFLPLVTIPQILILGYLLNMGSI